MKNRVYYGKDIRQYTYKNLRRYGGKKSYGGAGYRSASCSFGEHSFCHANSCACFCHRHGIRKPKLKRVKLKGISGTYDADVKEGYYSRDEYLGKH